MTDPAIIAASYAAERNYSHNPDDVIDSSDAVGAWGTTKESTTELVDISGNLNIADIHGAMPTEGFIQGRRFTAANENYFDCGNDGSLNATDAITLEALLKLYSYGSVSNECGIISKGIDTFEVEFENDDEIQFRIKDGLNIVATTNANIPLDTYAHIKVTYSNGTALIYVNGVEQTITGTIEGPIPITTNNVIIGARNNSPIRLFLDGVIVYSIMNNTFDTSKSNFNTLARLPFWSVNYTDYPDNVTEYTDNLPYSSSIITSGTFKVDDDKLQCISAGTLTYSASYEFDGSEYIKVEIDGVEYAGTGTITQGNTTVSVTQGSNKVTIEMGTGDTIDGIDIQFRAIV